MNDFEISTDEIWNAINSEGSASFSDDVKPNKADGGVVYDADDLSLPDFYNDDGELVTPDFDQIVDEEWDVNEDVSDLNKDWNEEDNAASLDASFYNIGEERVERETIERAYRAYSDFNARSAQLEEHIVELQETQRGLDEFHDIAVLQIDEDIAAYTNALESGRLNPSQFQEYSIAVKQLKQNKNVIQNKYNENLQRIEADKVRAEKLAFKDTVITLKHQKGWTNDDFNDVVKFVNDNGIKVNLRDMTPSLFIALQKSIRYDRSQSQSKEKLETKVQKAVAGKPVREGKRVDTASINEAKRAAAKRAAEAGTLPTSNMFEFLVD